MADLRKVVAATDLRVEAAVVECRPAVADTADLRKVVAAVECLRQAADMVALPVTDLRAAAAAKADRQVTDRKNGRGSRVISHATCHPQFIATHSARNS
jgi:hypothetical protein